MLWAEVLVWEDDRFSMAVGFLDIWQRRMGCWFGSGV
jgi:hypothetical protein